MILLGFDYFKGGQGFQQDYDKSLELFHRATEYGLIDAHNILGTMYGCGEGVPEDNKKTKYHLEIAAIAGHVLVRHNLGVVEENIANLHRAMKHFMISASAGYDESLKGVQNAYRVGFVTKDDFEKTLRAHKKSKDELMSEWRDKAAVADYAP